MRRARVSLPLIGFLALHLLTTEPIAAEDALGDFHRSFSWTTYGRELGREGFEILESPAGNEQLLVAADAFAGLGSSSSRAYVLDLADGRFRQVATSFLFGWDDGLRSAAPWRSAASGYILLTSRQTVRVVSSNDWTEIVTIPLPFGEAQASLVGDVLPAPGEELAVCDADDLHVFSYPAGSPLLTRSGFGCRALQLFQRDSDPEHELLISGNPLGLMVLGGPALTVEWADTGGRSRHVEVLDLGDDGDLELIYGLATPEENPSVARGLRAMDPRTNELLWEDLEVLFEDLAVGPAGGAAAPSLLLSTTTGLEYRAISDGTPAGSLPNWSEQVRRARVADLDGNDQLEALLVTTSLLAGEPDRIVAVDLASGQVLATSEDVFGWIENFAVGDFDADGGRDIASLTRSEVESFTRWTFIDRSTREIEYLEPVVPLFESAYGGAAALQMDSDLQSEVCSFRDEFASSSSYVRCDDSLTHEVQLQYQLPQGYRGSELAIADLDGDLVAEIVASTAYGGVLVLDSGTGDLRWAVLEAAGGSVGGNRLRIGELDGDAAKEIVVGGSAGCCDAAIVVYDDGIESLEYGPFVVVDHTFEIAPSSSGPGFDLLVSGESGAIRTLDLASGQLSAPIASFPAPVNSIRVADVTRDGVADWVVLVDDHIVVRDGALEVEVWSGPDLGWDSGYHSFREALWIEELPGSAPPWIFASLREGIVAFEAPLIPIFLDGFESGDTDAWSSVTP
jgi:hypothetical protein